MKNVIEYKVTGLMSGTSLDGLDMVNVIFTRGEKWLFRVIDANTIPYSLAWKTRLSNAMDLSDDDLDGLDDSYGAWIGEQISNFLTGTLFSPEIISSHGHTVFHQPLYGLTRQIGSGEKIKEISGITTINNFRELDVALGGQGAPLVPIGDIELFNDYDNFLNLGGIANIFMKSKMLAYDVCPCNMVLNTIALELGLDYDADGGLARSGSVDHRLLERLREWELYNVQPPKSIGREHVDQFFGPLISNGSPHDYLATMVAHISDQLGNELSGAGGTSILVTGGGVHNHFLLEKLKSKVDLKVIIPGREIVDYKEAIIFGFMGLLRYRGFHNCISQLTGASRDCCAGDIFH